MPLATAEAVSPLTLIIRLKFMDFLSGVPTDHLQLSSSTLTPLLNADNASEPIGGGNLSGVSKMITVNSTADAVDNSDGVTTLREAINFANADTTEDAIIFDSSVFATPQTISLSLGELNITHNLSIIAPRDSSTGEDLLTISGNNASRVFEIGTAATVTLSGLIIANAKVSDSNGGGTLTISNSTVNENSTTDSTNGSSSNLPELILSGGGIFNSGILTLLFTTITGNQAADGGGVFNDDVASTTVRDTIIASNLNSTGGNNPEVFGDFTSLGYNLIGDATGSTGFNSTGDIVGTSDNPIDPRLDALLFNSTPTATLALLPDSPAIDAGDPSVLATDPTTDQRGQPRVSGMLPDIGAFEFSQA